jgi:uncharacterized DUF497 family protein
MNGNFIFSIEKSKKLKKERGISFEECVGLIEAGHVIHITPHHNQENHPNQLVIVLNVNGYAYGVPCTPEGEAIRLHTIYRSRKLTRDYLKEQKS